MICHRHHRPRSSAVPVLFKPTSPRSVRLGFLLSLLIPSLDTWRVADRHGPKHPHPVHTHVHAASTHARLQCRPMSQTPIYDQLRGERINADVPTPGVDPQQVDHTGQDRLPVDATSAAAVFARRPGPGANLAANSTMPC
jgi:hypothetical protein